jgi:hypothetical protein
MACSAAWLSELSFGLSAVSFGKREIMVDNSNAIQYHYGQ